MPALAPRPARKRSETRNLVKPIEAALNRLPGVRVARNNTGLLRDARGIPVRFGLGTGSADLVGIVSLRIGTITDIGDATRPQRISLATVGRAFCLEVKLPGKKPRPDQVRWARVVRSLGGFCCVAHSLEEAMAAVERCRRGESE